MLRQFFLASSGDHRDLHSFPTRRSSDLIVSYRVRGTGLVPPVQMPKFKRAGTTLADAQRTHRRVVRSEEHTSELQSLRHLVCRLLLEKKKTKNILIDLIVTLTAPCRADD